VAQGTINSFFLFTKQAGEGTEDGICGFKAVPLFRASWIRGSVVYSRSSLPVDA